MSENVIMRGNPIPDGTDTMITTVAAVRLAVAISFLIGLIAGGVLALVL
jgi:hypothetical protein